MSISAGAAELAQGVRGWQAGRLAGTWAGPQGRRRQAGRCRQVSGASRSLAASIHTASHTVCCFFLPLKGLMKTSLPAGRQHGGEQGAIRLMWQGSNAQLLVGALGSAGSPSDGAASLAG